MRKYIPLSLVIILLSLIPSAQAATFIVLTPSDLINAIITANANGQNDVIELSGDIVLSVTDNNTNGANGLPTIAADGGNSLTIEGNGFSISRSTAGGTPEFRILHVAANASLILNNLELSNGDPAFLNVQYDTAGGAILNFGSLELNRSLLHSNRVDVNGAGGAIYNRGILNINESTIRDNFADQSGGGVLSDEGDVTITNSVFYNNNGNTGIGGGFYMSGTNPGGSPVSISNSTFSGNYASINTGGVALLYANATLNNLSIVNNDTNALGAGGLWVGNGSNVTISNSIVSNNTGGPFLDCYVNGTGVLTANANNIFGQSGDAGNCPNGASDIVPTGAVGSFLDTTLADNGGTTLTHALFSPGDAIDASGGGATTADQRGAPANGTRDIGAFEFTTFTEPSVQFANVSTAVNESTGTVTIPLSVTGAVNFSGIAEVYVSDLLTGTATDGTDYGSLGATTLTIDCSSGTCPGFVFLTISITVDNFYEIVETINLEITGTNALASVGTQDTSQVLIQDLTTMTLTANDPDATENPVDNGQFTLDLGSVNDTGAPITVAYSIAGTATNGTDYTTIAGTIDIPDGAQTVIIDILPLDDPDYEGSETVILAITSPSAGGITVDNTLATVTIADDELPPVVVPPVSGGGSASPAITVFDPAISKLGLLFPGQTGIVGEELEWLVTVSNVGSIAGTNVSITDTLIPALQIDSVNAPGASVTIVGQTVTVTYPTLAVGQTVNFSIFTTVLQGTSISNTACVNATNQGAQECVTALPISQLPSTGESPFWRYVMLLGILSTVLLTGFYLYQKRLVV